MTPEAEALKTVLVIALCGGGAVLLMLTAWHSLTKPLSEPRRITITMPNIGDPLTGTGGEIPNVPSSPAATNGLLMIIAQELRAIRATVEATTGMTVRPASEQASARESASAPAPQQGGE